MFFFAGVVRLEVRVHACVRVRVEVRALAREESEVRALNKNHFSWTLGRRNSERRKLKFSKNALLVRKQIEGL